VTEKVELEILAQAKQARSEIAGLRSELDTLKATVERLSGKKVDADFTSFFTAADKANKLLDQFEAKLKKKTLLEIKADEEGLRRSLAVVDKEVQKTERLAVSAFKRLKDEASKNIFGGLDESAKRAGRALTSEFNSIQRAFDNAVNRLNQASRRAGFDPLSEGARKLRENVRLAAEDLVAFGQKVPKAIGAAGPPLDAFNAKIKQAQTALKQFGSEQPIKPSFFSNINAARAAVTTFLASLAVRPLIDFGKAAFDAAANFEALEGRFKGLLGAERGAKELDHLREVADRLGISFLGLSDQFASFALAAEQQGFAAQETADVYEAIATTVRGAGLNTQQASLVLSAFTQIMQKGKIQAEELVKQLGQFLPATALLQKSLGLTGEEFIKLQKEGAITSKELLGFAGVLVETFGPAATENIDSSVAAMARFENAVLDAKLQVGNQLLPAVNDLLTVLIKTGKDGSSALKDLGEVFATIVRGAALVTESFTDFDTSRITAAIKIFGADATDVFRQLTANVREALRSVAAFSPALVATLAATEGAFRRSQASLEDFAATQRRLAREILDGHDQQRKAAEDAAKAQEDLQARLVKASRDAKDKQIQDAKALTKAQKEEFAQVKKAYEDLLSELSKLNRGLTDAEKTELAKRAKAYEDLKKILIDKEEELTEKTRKELDKRRGLTENYFNDLVELANSAQESMATVTPNAPQGVPTGTPGSVVQSDDLQKVNALTEALKALKAEKEALEADPTLDIDQSNRLGEIGGEIARLEQQLANAPQAFQPLTQAFTNLDTLVTAESAAFSQKFAAAIDSLVTKNQEFRDDFKLLPSAAQAAIEAVINDYKRLSDAGLATASDVVGLAGRIQIALASTGASSSSMAATFAAAFGTASGAVDSTAAALSRLKTPVDGADGSIKTLAGTITRDLSGSVVAFGAAATTAGGTITTLDGKVKTIGDTAATAGGKIVDASGKVIEIGASAPPETAEKGIEAIGTAAKDTEKKVGEASKPVADFGNVIGTASTKVDEAGTAADKLNTALSALPGYLQAIVDIAPALAPAMQTLATAFATNEGPVGNVVSLFLELDSHLLAIAENAPKVVTAVNGIAEAGKAEGTDGGISKLATAFAELLKSVGPVATDLDRAKTALDAIIAVAKESPKAIDELNKAFESFDSSSFVTDAEKATKAISGANTELGKAKTATEGWATALGQVKTGLDGSLSALKDIKTAAAEFAKVATEDLVPSLRDMAVEFTTIGAESPKLGKVLEFIVKEGVQGVKDLTIAVRELAIEIRENAVPAANELAAALANAKLP